MYSFQIKEICFHVLCFLFSLLIKDVCFIKFSKETNVEIILFKFLYQINETESFELYENLFILNFLINLTTNGEFYKRIENKLFCKSTMNSNTKVYLNQNFCSFSSAKSKNQSHFSFDEHFLLNRIDHYDKTKNIQSIYEQYVIKFSKKVCKFKMQTIWFLDVLIRILFEIVKDPLVIKLYLSIFHDFIKVSQYNLAFASNNTISLKLLLYFRFEQCPEIISKISLIIRDLLKNNTKVSHLRVLSNILKFPFDANRILKSVDNSMIFENKEILKTKSNDPETLKFVLSELSGIIKYIVKDYHENTPGRETLYFSGNSSGIILKKFSGFPSKSFSIVFQIKFENLLAFQKQFISETQKNCNISKESSVRDSFLKRSFNISKIQSVPRFSNLNKNHLKEFHKIPSDKILEVEINKILNDGSYPEIQMISTLLKDTPKKYTPTIFSLFSGEHSSLKIYLDEDKKNADTESKIKKSKTISQKKLKISFEKADKFEQTFLFDFEENKWYDIVLCFKEILKKKIEIELFVDGIKRSSYKNGELNCDDLEIFNSPDVLAIGCDAMNFLKQKQDLISEENIKLIDCFAGDLKNLMILDISLNEEDSKKIFNMNNTELNAGDDNNSKLFKSKNVVMSLDDFSILAEIKLGFDFAWFEILNKNEIRFLEIEKMLKIKETQLQSPTLKTNVFKKILNFFNIKKSKRKSKLYNDYKIIVKEVALLENTTFFETLFTLGSVEVIFYLFEIVISKQNKLTLESK